VEMGLWDKFTRTPEERLEAAGVRPGDIPIETHGRLWVFYGALLKSQSGDTVRRLDHSCHSDAVMTWNSPPASSGPTHSISGRRSAPPLMLSVGPLLQRLGLRHHSTQKRSTWTKHALTADMHSTLSHSSSIPRLRSIALRGKVRLTNDIAH
jgi:hypothetical protein